MTQKHTMPVFPGSAGSPGVRSTGAYLMGARPYIVRARLEGAGTPVVYKVEFPYVTRAITITNQDADGHDVEIAFANHANAWDHHSVLLNNNRDSITMNVRSSTVYLRATTNGEHVDVEIFAELTSINAARHEEWGSSDQSRSGVDTDIAGTTYPDTTATNDIIQQS